MEQQKKKFIIAGALVAVVAIVLVYFVFLRGGGPEVPSGPAEPGAAGTTSTATTPAGGAGTTAAVPTPAAGATGAVPPPVSAMGAGGAAPAAGAAGAAAALGGPLQPAPAGAKAPPVRARGDPFMPFPLPKWYRDYLEQQERMRQPVPVYTWALPTATVKIAYVNAADGLDGRGPDTFASYGTRRMSGILFDGRVFAILETQDGRSHVVKPGDTVLDGVRVAAVSRNSMVVAEAGKIETVSLKGKPMPTAAPAGGAGAAGAGGVRTGTPYVTPAGSGAEEF